MRRSIVLLVALLTLQLVGCQKGETTAKEQYSAYLFAYFTGNSGDEEAIRFALSDDGYNYKALNDNKPIISSSDISLTGGVRDPHILRSEDGKTFYMVVTDMVSDRGWDSNRGIVLLKSNDLVNWTSSTIHFPTRFAGQEELKRVWAPQTIYDAEAKKYLIYFSTQYSGGPDIIHYLYANDDFTDVLDEPTPLSVPRNGTSCLDGAIIPFGGEFHMFYKTEGSGNGIKKAVTKSLTSGEWQEWDDYKQCTNHAVEGSCVFKLIGGQKYILMYDVYMNGSYQFCESEDLSNFRVVDDAISMNFHPRHGTVMPITKDEAERLKNHF